MTRSLTFSWTEPTPEGDPEHKALSSKCRARVRPRKVLVQLNRSTLTRELQRDSASHRALRIERARRRSAHAHMKWVGGWLGSSPSEVAAAEPDQAPQGPGTRFPKRPRAEWEPGEAERLDRSAQRRQGFAGAPVPTSICAHVCVCVCVCVCV